MEWSEFRSRIDTIDVCYGQESKVTNGVEDELPEWQPRLELNKGSETSYVLMEVCQDIEARQDEFGIQVWQNGNRVGGHKDNDIQKWNSGYWGMTIKGVDNDVKFPRIGGGMAGSNQWDSDLSWVLGWITSPGSDELLRIPAGKYVMTIAPQ